MDAILESLYQRKSVRTFEDRPVPPDVREAVLQAAAQAPTAGNQMLYTILDITDPALKSRLAETCDHQPFIAKAPMVLIFVADCRRWLEAYRFAGCQIRSPGPGDFLLACTDAVIAAQNAVAAAESFGIGSCYIGDILENCETHRELLRLPEYTCPAAMLVFGYPTEQQKHRPKPQRFDLKYLVHENAYRPLTRAETEEMFRERAAREGFQKYDFETDMAAFCKRKYQSDFAQEMSRSVAVYLRDYFHEGKDE